MHSTAAGGDTPVTIEVANDLTSEARVYLDRASDHRRLGTVLPGQTSRFAVPVRIICGFDVRLSVSWPDGAGDFASETFVTWPGEVLKFRLRPNGAVRFGD